MRCKVKPIGGKQTAKDAHLELPHGLIQASQVAVVFGCLDIELSKGLLRQLQRRQVKVVRLLQKTLLRLFIVAVDGDFFQDESWREEEEHVRPLGRR